MAKRKRDTREADSANQKLKRRYSKQKTSSDYSEAANTGCSDTDMVIVPPPKSKMNSRDYLTFPMGQTPRSLPDCDGPKLQPFLHGDVQVRFIKQLGTNAVHSNVFEVDIKGKRYALKVFRTFSAGYLPNQNCWPQGASPKSKDMSNYFRPFYQECRAYGCINESDEAHRYWRCYGYLKLPSHLRDELCKITGFPHHYWQVRPPEFGRTDKPTFTKPSELSWPLYATVKELAPFPSAEIDLQQRSVRSMLTDLRKLHKIGVINSDIADRNYISGRIVDFSSAFTLPNPWFDRLEGSSQAYYPNTFRAGASYDMLSLRCMINESGIKTTAVAPDGPADGWVSVRTRRCRARRTPEPFYELGVKEPPPRRRRSSNTSWLSR